jgi:hypothetical protein
MATMTAPVAFDPVALATYAFGHDHWWVPERILREVFKPHSRVAVKSCHASSKSFTAADAVLMALLVGGDVIVTAPTWTQVEQVLFGQVHAAIATGRVPLSDWGAVNRTEIRLPSGEFALGLSTDVSVRFQGYHSRPGSFLLIVFDEAPGVRTDIYEAVEGIRAGGDVRLLFIGNPVIASGPFFDLFYEESVGWHRETISAFDTPNLEGLTIDDVLAMSDAELDDNVRPYLITRRFVYEKWHEWGPDHPLYQSRVLGAFPLQSDDALLSLAWLESAATRSAGYDPALTVQAGIDVAGPGDDETVLCIRQGDAILHLEAWADADARGKVLAALRPWKQRGLDAVNVDVAGLGHYFGLSLSDEGYPVVPVNVGESPTTDKAKEKFLNLRAEAFWNFREWAEAGMLAGLTDRAAIAQLAGIRYAHDNRGKIAIEKKVDARKRGVKSPDRAEAVVLAFWNQPRSRLGQAIAAAMSQGTRQPTVQERLAERRARLAAAGARRGWR